MICIPTMVRRDTNNLFCGLKTSFTNIVEAPKVSPEPPMMIVINKVPSTMPPRNFGI